MYAKVCSQIKQIMQDFCGSEYPALVSGLTMIGKTQSARAEDVAPTATAYVGNAAAKTCTLDVVLLFGSN